VIRLPDRVLPPEVGASLAAMQAEVDAAPDYAARVAEGKRLFELRNDKGDKTFDAIKVELDAMCSGARRCGYCEDSAADEVEHVRPKDLYPGVVFAWMNYLYACGPCNGGKNNHFAVFDAAGKVVEVARKRGAPVTPPIEGETVFIDPRAEDPEAYLLVDLVDTYQLLPKAAKGTPAHARAHYTIRELSLNRDALLRARKEAFVDFRAHLEAYIAARDGGAGPGELRDRGRRVGERQHPCVWREMKRLHTRIASIRELFARAPEALAW